MNCIICNAELSNPTSIDRGMGSECYNALQKARMKEVFKDEENRLTYNWLIEVNVMRAAFIDRFKNTNFRSEFKKSFYKSICQSDRVSKKQMKIINDMLFNAKVDIASLTKEIEDRKRNFLREKTQNIDLTVAIALARREIRNEKN